MTWRSLAQTMRSDGCNRRALAKTRAKRLPKCGRCILVIYQLILRLTERIYFYIGTDLRIHIERPGKQTRQLTTNISLWLTLYHKCIPIVYSLHLCTMERQMVNARTVSSFIANGPPGQQASILIRLLPSSTR